MIRHRLFTNLIFLILLVNFVNVSNCDYPNYTDAERDAIDKLRPLIADYLVPEYMKTDVYHLRLLKATKFDVENAVEMVKRTTEWRKHHNVDEILNQDLSEYSLDIPVRVEGVDKEGSPIVQMYYGKWKLRKYALSGDQELWNVPLKVFIHALETAEQTLYEIQKSGGQNISSVYGLDDIDGFSFKHHACPQCLSMTAEFLRTLLHYPSIAKKIVFMNVPKIFYYVTQLMNEILPSEIMQVISFYTPNNNKWRNEVLKDISADQLPKDFGGTQENWYNRY